LGTNPADKLFALLPTKGIVVAQKLGHLVAAAAKVYILLYKAINFGL
jgi:hypothetical protein